MFYGTREICDVVLRAKHDIPDFFGRKYHKYEPVLFFDSLKTSSMEQAVTTVYAQGGKGNARLVGWDGDKTVTFVMEDALISPESFALLAGADSTSNNGDAYRHVTDIIDKGTNATFTKSSKTLTIKKLTDTPEVIAESGVAAYIMLMNDGAIVSEPIICATAGSSKSIQVTLSTELDENVWDAVMVDYCVKDESGRVFNLSPDIYNYNFYLEASTLWRDQHGRDIPAEYIIPNCRIQSNFTLSMAASGDPQTFTFTLDAFPDYTLFNRAEKVFAAIHILEDVKMGGTTDSARSETKLFNGTTITSTTSSSGGSSEGSGGTTPGT